MCLTPADVGKAGCMWGTDDFLNWFQCVFNLRVFVINIQSYGESLVTTGEFVNDHFVQGKKGSPVAEEFNNNKYFDLNDKDRFVPYGIIIILMEEERFDRVFKLYNQTSPIVPCGSKHIEYLLPYLKISPTLWNSLDISVIEKHNSNIISRNKNDSNNELNFWFDHHFALE